MSKKRRPDLLPRGHRRHITDLRHIASFGLQVARSSGQLILDRSFTHFVEVVLAHGRCAGLLAPLAGDSAVLDCSLRSLPIRWSPPSSSDLVKPVDERPSPAEALIARSRNVSELVIEDDPNSRAEVDFWALVIRNDPGWRLRRSEAAHADGNHCSASAFWRCGSVGLWESADEGPCEDATWARAGVG